MTYSISKEESNTINIWKLAMMILIIFQHSTQSGVAGGPVVSNIPQELRILVYTFFIGAVNTFFFISGFLLFRKDFTWLENIKNKFWRLLIPYLFFNCFWIAVFSFLQAFPITQVFFINPNNITANWTITRWLNAFGYKSWPFVYPLWYLRDLFILNVFAILIKKAIDKFPVLVFILLLVPFTTSYCPPYFPVGNNSICFFCAGYYFLKYKDELSILNKVPFYFIAIVYFLLFLLVYKTHFTENYRWQYDQACIVFQMWFWYRLSKLLCVNNTLSSIANRSAKYIYPFFLMHEYLLYSLKKLLSHFFLDSLLFNYLDFALTPFLTLLICYCICKILQAICPSFYKVITGQQLKNTLHN